MFGSHRRDLKESHEAHVKSLMKLVEMLAEQVDYLRAKLDGHPYIGASVPSLNPSGLPPAPEGFDGPKYLSEEEEDLLALRLNEHISQDVLDELTEAFQLPSLEPDE